MMAMGISEILVMAFFWLGGLAGPLGVPAPADPMMARVAPPKVLFFMESNGVVAPDPKSKNETERLLAEPEVQAFLSSLRKQGQSALAALDRAGANETAQSLAKEAPLFLETFFSRPMAAYVESVTLQPMGPDVRGALVIHTGSKSADFRNALLRLEAMAIPPGRPDQKVKEVTVGGLKFRQLPTPPDSPVVMWGMKKELFIFALGSDSAQKLLARLDAKTAPATPAWLAGARESLAIDRPGSLLYLDIVGAREAAAPALRDPHVASVLEVTGLNNVTSFAVASGMDTTGTVSKSMLGIKGEPTGIFAKLGEKPLTVADFKGVPKDADFAMSVRFDLAELPALIMKITAAIDPSAAEQATKGLADLEQQLGFRFSEDLLAAVGDRWTVFQAPQQGGMFLTGLAATASVRDRARLEETLGRLQDVALGASNGQIAIREFTYRDRKVHYLQSTREPMPVAPAWCLTDDELIVALYPQMIKAILSRDANSGSLADEPEIARALAANPAPAILSYQDISSQVALLYSVIQAMAPVAVTELEKQGIHVELPILPSYAAISSHVRPVYGFTRRTDAGFVTEMRSSIPMGGSLTSVTTAPIWIGLLLPAVQSARQAARRTQEANNLRQIGLAMHMYEGTFRQLPVASNPKNFDRDGKPYLSWRVHALPFLEETALFDRFHLDEPWDSPNNKPLIELMPKAYVSPNHPELAAQFKTMYVTPVGMETMFSGKEGLKFGQVADGLSQTIMVLQVNPDKAVLWTKPDDLEYDAMNPLAGLSGSPKGGFQVLLGDGTVHFLLDSIDLDTLKAMFTRAGNEPVHSFD